MRCPHTSPRRDCLADKYADYCNEDCWIPSWIKVGRLLRTQTPKHLIGLKITLVKFTYPKNWTGHFRLLIILSWYNKGKVLLSQPQIVHNSLVTQLWLVYCSYSPLALCYSFGEIQPRCLTPQLRFYRRSKNKKKIVSLQIQTNHYKSLQNHP